MANNNTYTWKIAALEAYTTQSSYTDVVYNIHWRFNAVDQSTSYSAEVYGVQSVSPYNPDSGSFIPYEELTQNVVVGWLTGSMGDDRVGSLTASLDSQIQNQINPPTIVLPAPWNIPPTPTPTPTPEPAPTIVPPPTPPPEPPSTTTPQP